jgi:hypothetical protein
MTATEAGRSALALATPEMLPPWQRGPYAIDIHTPWEDTVPNTSEARANSMRALRAALLGIGEFREHSREALELALSPFVDRIKPELRSPAPHLALLQAVQAEVTEIRAFEMDWVRRGLARLLVDDGADLVEPAFAYWAYRTMSATIEFAARSLGAMLLHEPEPPEAPDLIELLARFFGTIPLPQALALMDGAAKAGKSKAYPVLDEIIRADAAPSRLRDQATYFKAWIDNFEHQVPGTSTLVI